MSAEESDDELPAISVNSSACNSSELVMPSAVELAEQRARERRTERELLERRRWHEWREAAAAGGGAPPVARLAHSDSSGSEGEAALAAAVLALRVHGPPAAPAAAALRARPAARLLAALARLAPADGGGARLLSDYAHLLETAPARTAAAATDKMVSGVCGALAGGGGGGGGAGAGAGGGALQCAAAWLCAVAAAGGRAGRRARRALHCLLDAGAAAPDDVWRVARLLSGAAGEDGVAGAVAARAQLELGDAARSGGGAGADLLAALMYRRALAALLGAAEAGEGRAALRAGELAALVCGAGDGPAGTLAAPARLVLVQLAGRVLAGAGGAGEAAERARVLAALAHLSAPRARNSPDHLKVAVSKLQLLFCAPAPPAPAHAPPAPCDVAALRTTT